MISDNLFTGKLVRLCAPHPDDKDALARWSQDSEFGRLLDSDPARPRPPDFYVEDDKDKQRREARRFEFRVRTLGDDKLIGFTELSIDWSNQVGWLGIGIGDRDYWGKGYGSDALRLTVNYAFRELNVYRVSLGVFSYNTRAIRAYEKAGFTREGVLRCTLYRDGQRYDEYVMGILRPEWEQLIQRQA
ncbi:MAG: GNAT family N-acetyltransferase [Anaerolineae bacterium]|nr:GNAT family N-acetyltransferase [Anaerolineae bacterium]